MRDALDNQIKKLAETLSTGDSAKAARADKVTASHAALAGAEAEAAEKKAAKTKAAEELKAAEASVKAAAKAIRGHGPEAKKLAKAMKEAEEELEEFRTGPLVALNELVA